MGTLENPRKEGKNKVYDPFPWKGIPGSQKIYPDVGKIQGTVLDLRSHSKEQTSRVSDAFLWDCTNSSLSSPSQKSMELQTFSK